MMIPTIKPCEKSFEPVTTSSGRNIPAVRRITVFQYSAQSLRIMLITNCGNKDSLQAWLFVFSEQIGSTRVFDDVTFIQHEDAFSHLIEIVRDVGRQQDRDLFLPGELAQEMKYVESDQGLQSCGRLIQY